MGREIVVLRHAHAEMPLADISDSARPLSARGHNEAKAVKDWFITQGFVFDLVLCSPAERTKQTLALVLDEHSQNEVRFMPEIYNATPGILLDLLDQMSSAKRILLIGHNPGLEQLVALLVEGRSEVLHGLPTAGVAVLRLMQTSVEPGTAELKVFWSPTPEAGV
jgi:phosphohistidine phosphatase